MAWNTKQKSRQGQGATGTKGKRLQGQAAAGSAQCALVAQQQRQEWYAAAKHAVHSPSSTTSKKSAYGSGLAVSTGPPPNTCWNEIMRVGTRIGLGREGNAHGCQRRRRYDASRSPGYPVSVCPAMQARKRTKGSSSPRSAANTGSPSCSSMLQQGWADCGQQVSRGTG